MIKKECKCNDIVLHVADIFRIEEKLKTLEPRRKDLDLPIPERINKIFAYPDIESFEKGYISSSGLLAICADNKKAIVSDDFDAFHQDADAWRRKAVTLKKFREMSRKQKEEYISPEVLINKDDICTDNIFGAFITQARKVIPLKIGEIYSKEKK